MNFFLKMSSHSKMALIIAPFLLIGGYIATDYYMEITSDKKNLFQLKVQGSCNILANKCVLKHEALQLNLSDKSGVTQIESNHALESAALSIINNKKEYKYRLLSENNQHWQADTQLEIFSAQSDKIKLRLIVTVNKGYYFAEFETQK